MPEHEDHICDDEWNDEALLLMDCSFKISVIKNISTVEVLSCDHAYFNLRLEYTTRLIASEQLKFDIYTCGHLQSFR